MSEEILSAIHDDDRVRVKRLLQADPSLAALQIGKARLYETKIVHWIYTGDTPLHLAAAGYRVEIVRLLLAAGADPSKRPVALCRGYLLDQPSIERRQAG